MAETNKVDFFEYGKKFANETKLMIETKAKEIEKEYGNKARMDFENGCAAYFPIFEENEFDEEIDFSKGIGAIREQDYGEHNMRNGSYFGTDRPSQQYVTRNGKVVYNEPKKRK